MSYLSTITHPNPIVSEKVNYFCSYFKLCNKNLGRLPRYRFGCPSYTIFSIVYQLENNLENCRSYVINLIESISSNELSLLSLCINNSAVVIKLKEIINGTSRGQINSVLLEDPKQKLKFLKRIFCKVEKNEILKLITCLTQRLSSGSKLSSIKAELEYLAITLVTIYRMKGFSESFANQSLNQIFAKNLYFFPFPNHIDNIEVKSERLKLKAEYLENLNFAQQFGAIKDGVNRRTYKPYVIFKILNVEIEEGVVLEFKYNGAQVIDQNHDIYEKIVNNISCDEYLKDFLPEGNYILCYFKVETLTNVGDKREEIYTRLQSVVDYINARMFDKVAKPHFQEYLTTLDFETFSSGHSYDHHNIRIFEGDPSTLKDNASHYMEDVNNSLKKSLLHTEDIFWRAKNQKDLVKQWIYLENSVPENENGNRLVCKTVSSILLYRKKKIVFWNYSDEIINIFSSTNSSEVKNIPNELLSKIRSREFGESIILKAGNYSKNKYIKSIRDNFVMDRSRSATEVFRKHWNEILVEARAYRNMVIHAGEYNPYLKIKLEICLLPIVDHYRYSCVDLVLENKKRKDYDKLILAKVKAKEPVR